jgi:hypothetical protein
MATRWGRKIPHSWFLSDRRGIGTEIQRRGTIAKLEY